MASHSLPIPLSPARKSARERTSVRAPSMRLVLTVSIALLILFSWLRLILALEIATTGRQIQLRTRELEKIERDSQLIQLQIAEAMSPSNMARLNEERGFTPHAPVYVPVSVEALRSPSEGPAETAGGEAPPASSSQSLWDLIVGKLDSLLEARAAP
jgi:hypothetical protein